MNPEVLLPLIVGTMICFGKTKAEQRRFYVLSALLENFELATGVRATLELIIFMFFGCIIAYSIAQPQTSAQAVTAGLAWTAMTSTK